MKVYETVVLQTDDKNEEVFYESMVGKKLPYAFFVNLNCHGYAKFKIDPMSIKAFEQKLSLIESSMNRKQIYNMLYEMMKDGDISGAFMIEVYKKHLSSETNDSVISDSLQSSIPPIIKNYMPLENFEKEYEELFRLIVGLLA